MGDREAYRLTPTHPPTPTSNPAPNPAEKAAKGRDHSTERKKIMGDLQALVDGLSAQLMRDRAETQMTLGAMIAALEAMHSDAMVANISEAHSYCGYYSDLAFEQSPGQRLAKDLLKDCKGAMGKVFKGYKGGGFVMGELTPVWVAEYGCCGQKIMAFMESGDLVTAEDV